MSTDKDFPIFEDQNPDHWDYKAEGFDSLICSFCGPIESPFHQKVIRFFKVQEEGFRRGGGEPISNFKEHVKLHEKLINTMIRPILPSIDSGLPFSVSEEFISKISEKITPKRSSKRIMQSHISIDSCVILLHDDHILPNGLTIELKPKWGFLPDCCLLPPDSVKRKFSRYQLMQQYKLQKGDIKQISHYNPPDLFSGTTAGVQKALNDLYEIPQDNLKVFRNGNISKLTIEERDILVPILVQSEEIKQLLMIQKLDVFDIEFMGEIVQKADDPTWNDFLFSSDSEKIKEEILKMTQNHYTLSEDPNEVHRLIESLEKLDARIFVLGFLLSQAAKDVSLMITFQDSTLKNPHISVIDFDLKLPQLIISHYYKEDQKIIAAFQKM